jgi:hypothetical protein
MKSYHLTSLLGSALLIGLLPGTVQAQVLNPAYVEETDTAFIVQPDLDGDSDFDLVIVDRASGLLRAALEDGGLVWLPPVATGLRDISAIAAGTLVNSSKESVAVVSESGNRVNLFTYSGGTLNALPVSIFNDIFGLRELAVVEDPNGGAAATNELFGFSKLFAPSLPGRRDYLVRDGIGMISYGPGYPAPAYAERDYRRVQLEPGLSMLGFFEENNPPGLDTFNLIFTEDGSFDIIQQIKVPSGAQLMQASFDGSGRFHFVFHQPGSSEIDVYFWEGSNLAPIGAFSLDAPASRLFPFISESGSGFFALSPEGTTATFYAFNGVDSPSQVTSFSANDGQPIALPLIRRTGDFYVLTESATGGIQSVEQFSYDESSFTYETDSAIPPVNQIAGGSNVLLFSSTPFIDPDAPLTGKLGSGVWTSAVVVGAQVDATVESFGGPLAGLQNPVVQTIGTTPTGTTDALPNQVEDDISLYDRAAPIGVLPGTVLAEPDPGTYDESITMQFIASSGLTVYHRVLPSGSWVAGSATAGPFLESFSVQFFGEDVKGQRTPIQTNAYTISIPIGLLDSDEDGIPDFVEKERNLDPVNSGDDGDLDGAGDLIEILAGSNAGLASSIPPSRENDQDGDMASDLAEAIAQTDPGNPASVPEESMLFQLQNVFDLLAVPISHDGTSAVFPFVTSISETLETPDSGPLATTVRLYDAAASLLGYDRTRFHNVGGVAEPSALFEGIPVGVPELPLILSTERNFPIDFAIPDPDIGRQIVGLFEPPEVTLPPVPYVYGTGGMVPAVEANLWIEAAREFYLSQTRPLFTTEFDLYDTLILLLVELKLEEILTSRGLLSGDAFTLTSFRPNEAAVPLSEAPGDGSKDVFASLSDLENLRFKDGLHPGYRLPEIIETIRTPVEAAALPAVIACRDVVEAIYATSAASANDNPGAFVAPIDAVRQFLRTGNLDNTGYLSEPEVAPLDTATLATAYSAVATLLALDSSRPVAFKQVRVTLGSESATCTVLEETGTSDSVSLVNFKGDPYPLPDAFTLPVGTELIVEGYSDVTSPCGADHVLEVIPPIQLVSLPVMSSGDANDNLIADDLEDLYPDTLSPFEDSDMDGFTDLQEALEGTNPFDSSDFPPGSPVSLLPPVIDVGEFSTTTFDFTFTYPAAFANDIGFRLFSGTSLNSIATDEVVEAVHLGSGNFQLIINRPFTYPVFYRFKLFLK